MSAKFNRHYEARLESIADDVKVWFVVYVYGEQSWREVWQCDSKEEAERLAAQRNAWMHAAETKGLRHFDLAPCPFCGDSANVSLKGCGECPECGAKLGPYYVVGGHCGAASSSELTQEAAADKWNSRAKKEGGDHA